MPFGSHHPVQPRLGPGSPFLQGGEEANTAAEGVHVRKLLTSGAILLLGGTMILVFSVLPAKEGNGATPAEEWNGMTPAKEGNGMTPAEEWNGMTPAEGEPIQLPEPRFESGVSVEQALRERRSVRTYGDEPLTLEEAGQLLWAAQGITEETRGLRTAPSAGALYPMEVFLVVRKVEGLSPGVYRYLPRSHDLESVRAGDRSGALAGAALGQAPIREAPAVIVLAGVYARTRVRYGDRTERYVHMEAGHVGQNIALQAVALELSTVMMGAFQDQEVARVLGTLPEEVPLYIIPVGR
jgi:SagB-type dehydrogenase family enzyme